MPRDLQSLYKRLGIVLVLLVRTHSIHLRLTVGFQLRTVLLYILHLSVYV